MNAEKYLQILNIHYIQTRGLPGCHHGDDYGVGEEGGRREPSCPKHRTCSGEFLGRGLKVFKGLKCL